MKIFFFFLILTPQKVRVIDSCLRLHGSLCPQEMIPFHETLERFFRKNFPDEIRRLDMGSSPVPSSISPSSVYPNHRLGSLAHLHERNRSEISNVTSGTLPPRREAYLPPLQLGRSVITPPPASPRSLRTQTAVDGMPSGSGSGMTSSAASVHGHNNGANAGSRPPKQTLLQRNLAHLARHGFPGVSLGPGLGSESAHTLTGTIAGSGSLSAGSPQGSFVNVGSTLPPPSTIASGGASMATSGISATIKGRFSRLGSLNFGRSGREGRFAN